MKIDRLTIFQEAVTRLCSSLKIETALMRCFTYLTDFIPMDEIILGWYEPEKKISFNIASADPSGGKRINKTFLTPKVIQQMVEKEISYREVKIINQPGLDPVYQDIMKMMGDMDISVMKLPLFLDNVRIGSLVVKVAGTNQYSEAHAALLALLHDPFAFMLANTRQRDEILQLKDRAYDDNWFLSQEIRHLSGEEIIGSDTGLKHVMELTRQVAPLESPVLILGETGVGKELIANAIHYLSPRKKGPFIRVNCGAIADSLLDSELFGHEKGAFTGAASLKRGRLERAHQGTLFLDEIGELPLQAQVKLLRALQHSEIERVGGTETIPIDIRVIAATHRNIEEMISDGGFREDLWYRINVFPITIPPLRHRKMDIPALAGYFLKRKCEQLNIHEIPPIAKGAIEQLMDNDWRGNVRELENIMERALIRYRVGAISFDENMIQPTEKTSLLSRTQQPMLSLEQNAANHIQTALDMAKGKINGPGGAAELLDIHPNTLRYKMKKLGIVFGRERH